MKSTLLWILAALSRSEQPVDDEAPLPAHGRLEGFVHAVSRSRRLYVLGSVVFVLACLPGVLVLRSDVRATEFLSEESPSRQGLAAQDEHLGGVNVFRIEVECAQDGGAWAPETLEFDTFNGLTNPYTYSDMTGFALSIAGTPAG